MAKLKYGIAIERQPLQSHDTYTTPRMNKGKKNNANTVNRDAVPMFSMMQQKHVICSVKKGPPRLTKHNSIGSMDRFNQTKATRAMDIVVAQIDNQYTTHSFLIR
jgi:hypothetical protein